MFILMRNRPAHFDWMHFQILIDIPIVSLFRGNIEGPQQMKLGKHEKMRIMINTQIKRIQKQKQNTTESLNTDYESLRPLSILGT